MWPFHKQQKPIEKKAVLGTSESLGAFMIFGTQGAETPTAALNLYEKSTAVSVPIIKVTSPFASIVPVLEQPDGTFLTKHPVLDLLQQPSPLYDRVLFFETLGKNYLITGESVFVALGNKNRPPLELQPLSPSNVSPIQGPGGIAGMYNVAGVTLAGSYKLDSGRYFNGPLRELRFTRSFSTKNNGLLRGQSLLVSAAAEARQHILGNTHNVSLLEKGGRVSLAIHSDVDMEDDDFQTFKGNVRGQYGSATKAGEIWVTAGGKIDIKELGRTNKDMDFAKLQRMAMDAVALQYNVPLPLISNDKATFNNYQTSLLALYDNATLPLADRIFGDLSAFLLPRYKLDPMKYRITYDILSITALRMRVLEEIKLRKDIGFESDNELRGIISREPYRGGDQILKPANLIPAGTDVITDVD